MYYSKKKGWKTLDMTEYGLRTQKLLIHLNFSMNCTKKSLAALKLHANGGSVIL